MRILAALIVALLTLSGAARAQTPAQNCTLQRYGSVDMHIAGDKVFIPATMGSVQKEFEFNLNGAFSRMSPELADELKLFPRSLPTDLSVGKFSDRRVNVPELILGNVKLKNIEFLIISPEAKAAGSSDAISVAEFGKVDVEMDMAGKKLNFFSQDHCPGRVVYWTQQFTTVPVVIQEFGFVRPMLQLDGKPVTVALDLNSPSRITMGQVKQLFGLDENSPGMSLEETSPNGIRTYRYPFKSLGNEDLKVANPAIHILGVPLGQDCSGKQRLETPRFTPMRNTKGDELVTCYGGATMVLGYSVLSKLHLYISPKEKLLYLSAAGAK